MPDRFTAGKRSESPSPWPLAAGGPYIQRVPKRNLILLVVVGLSCVAAYAAREQAALGRRFGEVLSIVGSSSLEQVDGDELFAVAVDAALARVDEHSAYIRGDARGDLEATLNQKFGGVGLELAIDERSDMPVVTSPVVASPAWRAGIRVGDRIEAIDGISTTGVMLHDVVTRLRGVHGTRVTIRVARPLDPASRTLDPAHDSDAVGESRDVVLGREVIETESVVGDRRLETGRWEWMVEGSPGVCLVRITSFGERTATELLAALDEIGATAEAHALIVDLRGNPGGLLSSAVEVCDLFLDDCMIVYTRGRSGTGEEGSAVLEPRRATPGARLADMPVAVLVDGLTASAAEIVAACLQDARRATIVGSRTFGKGTVQTIIPLSDDRGLIKLTTSEYVRPNRENIHRRPGNGDGDPWGVMPDDGYEVAPTAEAIVRLTAWRRIREAAGPVPAWMAVRGLPREVDEVLRRGLDAVQQASSPRAEPDLGGQKKTSGDDHNALPSRK